MSSESSSKFCNQQQTYDLTFKILAIDFNEMEDASRLSVKVRFGNKSWAINQKGYEGVKEEQRDTLRDSKGGKDDEKQRDSKGGKDDEKQRDSSRGSKGVDRSGTQSIVHNASSSELYEKATEEQIKESIKSMRVSEASRIRASRVAASSRASSAPSHRSRDLTVATTLFGEVTDRIESAPNCLSESLSKHVIKYEITQNSNLIGK